MVRSYGYLLKKFPRLSETFILNELLAQERLGLDLQVFSRRVPDDEPRHAELASLRAPVHAVPHRRELDPWRTLFSNGGEAEAIFPRLGRLVREAEAWNLPRLSAQIAEALYVVRRTRELGIDHLHVHFATESAVVAMLSQELGGPTYSITAHAKDIYRSTVDWELLDVLFQRAQFVVTVCQANATFLRTGVGREAGSKVRCLYNGIDLETFPCRLDGRQPSHLLAVGRLVEKKGFDVLIEACREMRELGVFFRLSIVGEGEERGALESLIQGYDLEDRVSLLGPKDQTAVRELLGTATVFALPCRVGADGNRDALPTVLLEALASGLPVVSTPISGIPEILDHGRAGVLVPQDDPSAVAEAVTELLSSSARRLELARAGRAQAERCFDLRVNARKLHDWFRNVRPRSVVPCASPA